MGDIVNSVADLFGVGPASKQAAAAESAAAQSASASKYATDLQRQMYQEGVQRQQPWLTAGTGAVNQLAASLAPGGQYATPFSQTNWQQDPGYQFRLSEGLKAIDRSMAAKGLGVSGAALKAAGRYGQEAASQEYQNAFNRYYNERNQMLNPLQSLAGVGQTTANALGTAGSGYANAAGIFATTNAANQGNALLQQGNILASQYGTAGSALNTALNTDWGNKLGSLQGAFAQTGLGQSGFGTGAAYGNQDYGQYL